MKILVVASLNKGHYAPFITEQCEALKALGVEYEMFGIEGKGIKGYLRNLRRFKETVRRVGPDVIHAHYGLSGLFANLQREVPVVTTYHGSDINDRKARRFSLAAIRLSAHNIFVSQGIMKAAGVSSGKIRPRCSLIPCGVNPANLPAVSRTEARNAMGLDEEGWYVLFSGAFDNKVKNSTLALEAIDCLNGRGEDGASEAGQHESKDVKPSGMKDVKLLELKGYDRQQVNLLMNACNALLVTSFTEGSPQVVKEALTAGCPVVSVDAGDVKTLINGVEGCYMVDRTPESIADALSSVFRLGQDFRTNGRSQIDRLGLTNGTIARKVAGIYRQILQQKS